MKRAAVVALVVGAVIVPSSSAIESTIYPGVGIGKVKLGMTLKQVKKVLGASPIVNKRAQVHGHGYIEYGWNFSTMWVGFLNTRGVLHAVIVGTGLRTQRTPRGTGVGTSVETLQRRERVTCNTGPNADERYRGHWYKDAAITIYGWCVLGSPAEPTTIFRLDCASNGAICSGLHVDEVIVRTPF